MMRSRLFSASEHGREHVAFLWTRRTLEGRRMLMLYRRMSLLFSSSMCYFQPFTSSSFSRRSTRSTQYSLSENMRVSGDFHFLSMVCHSSCWVLVLNRRFYLVLANYLERVDFVCPCPAERHLPKIEACIGKKAASSHKAEDCSPHCSDGSLAPEF